MTVPPCQCYGTVAHDFLYRKERNTCLDKPACTGMTATMKSEFLPSILNTIIKPQLLNGSFKCFTHLFSLLAVLAGKNKF